MSTLNDPAAKQAAIAAATLSQVEAAAFTGVSAKSLDRLSAAGEPLGRIKIGRRVVYLRTALEKWLDAKTAPSA